MAKPRMSPTAVIISAVLSIVLALSLCLLAGNLMDSLTDLGANVDTSR